MENILQFTTVPPLLPTTGPRVRCCSSSFMLFPSSLLTFLLYTGNSDEIFHFIKNIGETQASQVNGPKPWLITGQRLDPNCPLGRCPQHHGACPSHEPSTCVGLQIPRVTLTTSLLLQPRDSEGTKNLDLPRAHGSGPLENSVKDETENHSIPCLFKAEGLWDDTAAPERRGDPASWPVHSIYIDKGDLGPPALQMEPEIHLLFPF